jgi:uncharacterized protein (TIGR04255 family)
LALSFGAHDDVVFAKAPLISVLCQIRFSPVLSLMSAVGAAGFQEVLRHDYPNFDPQQTASFAVTPEGVGVQRQAPVWRLGDADGEWLVGLATDFVALETVAYSDFSEFQSRLTQVLDAVQRTVRPSSSARIGLRKVNWITDEEIQATVDWKDRVRPELLGLAANHELPAEIDFAFSDVRFKDDENWLAIRYGLHPEKEKTFVLDMDYFTDRPYEVGVNPALTDLLRHYSDGMTSFFHWALLPGFLASLEPTSRNDEGVT